MINKLVASAAIIAALSVAPAMAMAQNTTNTTAMSTKKPMKAKKMKKAKAAPATNSMMAAPK